MSSMPINIQPTSIPALPEVLRSTMPALWGVH